MLVVVRLDPNRVQLKVFYSPTTPRRVRDWLHYQQADVAINGGYFNDQNVATALVIVDGVATGKSYSGFGGLFALRGDPQNLIPSLQWLKTKPYRPDKRIRYALQGSPMLVTEGTTVPGISDNGERNRRSFIALDKQGRVLLGICQFAQWTLTDLANYLAETKALEIQNALNLDGGASTGLWVNSEDDSTLTDSFEQVPLVIVGSSN